MGHRGALPSGTGALLWRGWARCARGLLAAAFGGLLAAAPPLPAPPVRIGVLAYRPVPLAQAQWQPMAAALQRALDGRPCVVEAFAYPELTQALQAGRLDFVLTNPGHFVHLNRRGLLSSPLATLAVTEAGHASAVFGGVIFCRADDPRPDALESLHGRRIAIPALDSLGGFQMQAVELARAGVRLPGDATLVPTGMPHDRVVEAVLSGTAEVGFVRTGVLEDMAREGKLDLGRIRLLHERPETGFGTRSSTQRYPEWPFAATARTDEALARRVTSALFLFEQDPALTRALGIAGFFVPANYGPVEDLLRDLRLPPFEAGPAFTLQDVGRRFLWHLAGAGLLAALALSLGLRLQVANRRLAQEQQREQQQQERLDLALSATGLGLYDWNPCTGEVVYDARWAAMFGHRLEELAPDYTTWASRVHPEDLAASNAAYEEAARGRAPYRCEYRMRHRDGSWRWVLDQGRIVSRDDQGAPTRVVGANLDITERRYLETRLSHARKMEGLGILAGGVAHEMNNVLGAILGLASLHLESQPTGTPLHRALHTIIKACNRGKDHSARLMGFARQRLAQEREVDLNALIREEIRLLEGTPPARVTLVTDLDPDLKSIRGDDRALSQLLMNLVANGLDAMPEGGALVLRSRNLPGGEVELEVTDSGIGMGPEVLAQATAPFFTTKDPGQGTGLGLAIAHSTMAAHQGTMDLHSEPGRGTRVALRFPPWTGGATASGPAPTWTEESGAYPTVPTRPPGPGA